MFQGLEELFRGVSGHASETLALLSLRNDPDPWEPFFGVLSFS